MPLHRGALRLSFRLRAALFDALRAGFALRVLGTLRHAAQLPVARKVKRARLVDAAVHEKAVAAGLGGRRQGRILLRAGFRDGFENLVRIGVRHGFRTLGPALGDARVREHRHRFRNHRLRIHGRLNGLRGGRGLRERERRGERHGRKSGTKAKKRCHGRGERAGGIGKRRRFCAGARHLRFCRAEV